MDIYKKKEERAALQVITLLITMDKRAYNTITTQQIKKSIKLVDKNNLNKQNTKTIDIRFTYFLFYLLQKKIGSKLPAVKVAMLLAYHTHNKQTKIYKHCYYSEPKHYYDFELGA